MPAVFAIDPSWVSTGWCFATEMGPVAAGRVCMKDTEDRDQDAYRVLSFLEGRARPMLSEYILSQPKYRARLVVEEPPPVVGRQGNLTLTATQLGRLVGACEIWGASEFWLEGPWRVPVATWRKHHEVAGRGREELKRAAIAIVRMRRWGHFLDPYPGAKAKDGGQQADVAEAILLAVYAVAFHHLGPRRPDLLPMVDGLRGTR